MRMRVDEINEEGGINGRKIKLVVEDYGYDPKKAVLAPQKMIERDKTFAVLGTIGTPVMAATCRSYPGRTSRTCFRSPVPRSPTSRCTSTSSILARSTRIPMRSATRYLVKDKGLKSVGVLYQDDDFGLEVMDGAEAARRTSARNCTRRRPTSAARPTSRRRCRTCGARAATWW